MKRWNSLLIVLATLLMGARVTGAGFIIVDDPDQKIWQPHPIPPHPIPPWPPRPIPPRPHPFAPLEVRSIKVNAAINDQLATTTVEEEFFNPNSARLEGTFLFPVPKGAHIDKFTMEIDGRMAEAELLSADRARHIYEDIVRRMKDPALLEYAGRDVFKVRIFPIEPNSKKRVRLSYSELLKSDDGLVSYLLPLGTDKFSAKPVGELTVKVELESKKPIKSIYSPSHSVTIKRTGTTSATASFEASDVQPEGDFSLYFAPEKDEIGLNLLTFKESDQDGYFLLLASPGVDVKEQHIVNKDVAFVLDTSGSMAGKKLAQARKALQFCVENLNDGDRFEIIRFSTEVEPLFDRLVEANTRNRERADAFIRDLRPIGGTAIDDALAKALALAPANNDGGDRAEGHQRRDRPFMIIFLTDGCPTIGITDNESIIARVKKPGAGKTRIFCFGIGTDVNTHLLDRITEETRAFSQYVLPEEDLEVKVSSFFSKIKEPVLANPTIHFTGDVRVSKLYPSTLPDLFKGEQLVLAGRYSGKGDSAVIVEGSVNGVRKKMTYEVRFPGHSSESSFIPRLWATRRVGHLLEEIRLHGENAELRDEVTTLAREYGIVTPYTAYLILEDETRREVPTTMRSFQSFDKDKLARQEALQNWNDFKTETGGEKAVAASRYGLALKLADSSAAAVQGATVESGRTLGLSSANAPESQPPAGRVRVAEYSRQTRFAGGKSFFQNNDQWIDSAVQANRQAKVTRIQFGSAEYFELATKNPNALPWLALGPSVQFVLDNTIYDIHE